MSCRGGVGGTTPSSVETAAGPLSTGERDADAA